MVKAFLISPGDQSVESVELSNHDEIPELIGYETIVSDELGEDGDRLFFDEECFIRGVSGRFQIDKLIPVAGKGVVVGTAADGSLADVAVGRDSLFERTRFE